MDWIIESFAGAVAFLIIASIFYFISKFSKNMFNKWDMDSKRFMVNVCIGVLVLIGVLCSIFESAQNIIFLFSMPVVIFLILLATNISATKK